MKKLHVGVLFGGTSSEREVSLISGKEVCANLPHDRYEVTPVEIQADGSWQIEPKDCAAKFDVVFIALHGGDGEGGAVQQILDDAHVPYTGSHAAASALAMDKARANQTVATAGITIPREITLEKTPDAEQSVITFGLPAVIKPNRSGSSVGVSIVTQKDQIAAALKAAFAEDSTIVVQEYITGRELTCGVMGNHYSTITPLPPVEIIPATTFFDYHAKYHATDTQEICPAQLTEDQTKAIQQQAVTIHQALGCDGLTRSDFIMQSNGTLVYLETNTIPGMTPASLCPKEAKAAGMSLADFYSRQIELALELSTPPQP